MDRERLIKYLEQRYISQGELINRIPLGVQPDELWRELLNRRRAKSTVLPISGVRGAPYWYVTTEKMIAASERVIEELITIETELDPYVGVSSVATLEEVFYTSYVEGSRITMREAMEFLQNDRAPQDIEEQMIANNRYAGSYAGENLYRPLNEDFLQELAYILTAGMDRGGRDYRQTDWIEIPSMGEEEYELPSAVSIPERVGEIVSYIADHRVHPLIKSAVAQAWVLVVRPFPEGNERLARLLSAIILIRAGYIFFGEISLSALIARNGYAYYEAVADILRPENGGDMTCFIEHFLDLLARAVRERKMRLSQEAIQSQAFEREMARSSLIADRAEPPAQPKAGIQAPIPAPPQTGRHQETLAEANRTKPDSPADPPGGSPEAEGGEIDDIIAYRIRDELLKCTSKKNGNLSRCSHLLISYIEQGKRCFTSKELEEKLSLDYDQARNVVKRLREKGLVEIAGHEGKYALYGFSRTVIPLSERDYSPELLSALRELAASSISKKDKRIGKVLLGNLPKGLVTVSIYDALGCANRWKTDMRLAEQMGLVEKVEPGTYRICRELRSGIPALRPSQKEAVTAIYRSFGRKMFSREMVTTMLECSSYHASVTLHQLTLLHIVDCRKEDVNLYQLLVNPQQHPQCFVTAA